MSGRSAAAADLRVYALDTGLIQCADYALYSPAAPPGTYAEMSVRSYLVVHRDGLLLWDTGIADSIAEQPDGERLNQTHVFRVPVTLRAQLEAIGHAPADVGLLGLSHLHIDHVGNLDLFPGATALMQQAEYDAAFGPDAEELTYIPEAYAALDRNRIQKVAGGHDVFGDGAVVTVPLPGHTPGHQGLLVALPETGRVLLAGDLAYSVADYTAGAVRRLNVDLDASRESIEAARALEASGVEIWLHHDIDAQREIETAPGYYG
ncbi:MAG: N-acyl homoserine lactonase family protein [Actinobacteria bacterium]|nr:N-acyl homoserine lactonase family protein [Actinomycetota bacterium]